MSAENAELVRAWLEALRGPQAFSQELDKIAQKGQRAGKVTQDAFGGASAAAMQVVGAITGIGSAVGGMITIAQQLKAEYQAIIDRQKQAADAQVSVFDAYSRAVNVLAAKKIDIDPDEMFKRVVKGANGRNPADLFLAFESGVNVAGDVSPERVLDTVMAANRMRPDLTAEQLKHTITSSLQLQKEFAGVTPEQSIAGILQSSTAAAPEDVAEYAKHMVPGIVMMRQFGSGKESFEDLAALSIGFGMRAGDTTGRRGTTNLINLLKQVKEETLTAGLVGPDATVEQQLEAVRNDPGMQAKLLGVFAKELGMDPKQLMAAKRAYQQSGGKDIGAHFPGEARTFIPAVELLSPGDNRTKQEIAAAKTKVAGLNDEAVSQVGNVAMALRGSEAGQVGAMERIRRQSDTQSLLFDPDAAASKTRDLLTRARQEAGYGVTQRGMIAAGESISDVFAPKSPAANLDRAIETARSLQAEVAVRAGRSADPEAVENLKAIVEELRALREDQKAGLKIKTDGAGSAVGGPAAPGLNDRKNGGASGSW